jgi:hypothetical protein
MKIATQGKISRFGDICMLPLMYLLQGTVRELPQQTHRWNNMKFPLSAISHLRSDLMVTVPGDPRAVKRWWGPLPIFHIPVLGGWSKFIVMEPATPVSSSWYIGWIAGDTVAGVSQIMISHQVRLLVGAGPAQFFGLTNEGEQIPLIVVGHGRIGQSGRFSSVPLL